MQYTNTESELNYNFLIVLIIVVAIALYNYYPDIIQSIQSVKNYFFQLGANLQIYAIVSAVFIILFFISYILYKSAKFVSYKTSHFNDEAIRIQIETDETEDILGKKLIFNEQELTSDIEEIKEKIKVCKSSKKLFSFVEPLKKRLAKATELLEELEKNKRADKLEERNCQLREENEKLEKERQERIYRQESNKKDILYRFNEKEEYVFLKENLTEKEIQALVENGYYSVAEYCIIKKDYTNVLIKPCLKHSPTHIFLVWNVKKLLKKIKGVENIREHLSVDADLTFRFQGKVYALEIETGSLLGKTKQIKEKLDYLNKKYQDRWMFIVSNKNLLSKYRKLGLTTQRSEAAGRLQKLLENTHLVLRGGK